jgi:phytoene desaturase
MSEQKTSHVVVIGGGVGGLAIAARLSVKGHRVTLLEHADRVGGKLFTYRRDGFAFDTGPSLFTLPAVYRDLFLKTGKSLEESIDLQEIDPAFRYVFADQSEVILPGVNPATCAKAFGDAFGAISESQWREFIARGADMWRLTRGPFLQSPLKGWKSLLPLANPRDVNTIAPFTSLRKIARKYFTDPRMIMIVDRYATYTGSDPRHAPAVLATIPYIEQVFGAWHIGGGLGTLATALEKRCGERGVEIRTGVTVTNIETIDDAVSGVHLDTGEFIAANLVVSNSDATLTQELLSQRDQKRVPSIPNSPSLAGFVLLLALEGTTEKLAHHNVWFPQNYNKEFDAIFGKVPVPPSDPAIYACVPNDPQMRPSKDTESWFVLVNAPRHDPNARNGFNWDTPGIKEEYAENILEKLAERGTDIRSRIKWMEIRTPADLEREVMAPGGSIYGTSSNGPRAAFTRPANQSAIAGLYLVGGSSHPGGGLPLVGMGAEITAELIGRAKKSNP